MSVPIEKEGMEALNLLSSTDPTAWLLPSESLSKAAKTASQHLFARVKPHVPKSPFDKLLVEGFDAEQIWQQLDLQSQPLISSLSRQVNQWETNPEEIIEIFKKNEKKKVEENESERKDSYDEEDEFDGDDVDMEDFDDDEEEEDGEEEEHNEEGKGVEDKFLKIKELEEFLEEDEAREYGLERKSKKKKRSEDLSSSDEEEDEEDEDEENEDGEDEDEDEDDDELGLYEDGGEDDMGNIKYGDFFGDEKKKASKGKLKLPDELEEESDSEDELDVGGVNKENGELSTHEKQLQKLQSEIEQMEKENLESKHWTMQGEVTAANRPKNSALEEVLDYQRKARAPIVIDKDFHASLEDMIKERIIKGQFDDVERIASVPSKGPREQKELDDNKSKKGLAEVYEEEYVHKTNPAAAPSSFTDEQKKEASLLFKKLCLKLDALSHFHFAPKPVIEDMSIQANVPALAMEEIAPVAVSDAAMLAPEEVYSGKGDIKDEAELTQAERKRRRANKKRKFKAETAKRMAKMPKKAEDSSLQISNDGKEE